MSVTKKIKVLECIRQGQIGGGESHLLSLVENIDRSRFDPAVLSFTAGPMVDRLEKMGIPVTVLHTERPFDLRKWNSVKKILIDGQFDLVHAHGTRAGSNVLWAARSLRIPFIYSVHGWSFHDDQHPLVRRMRIWGESWISSRSSLNISVSESNRQTGLDHIRSFDSVVINNGIDQHRFDPQKKYPNIREQAGIGENEVVVVFIARFTVQKQPLTLIRAFGKALIRMPSLHLLMVGEGDQRVEVEKLANEPELRNKISLFPFRLDVPDILAASDIFVLPSLWEGLPIGLLEAMAMGKAVIASDADGTKEVVKHNENGWLISTDDLVPQLTEALVKLGRDSELRKRFQQKAVETINDRFSARDMTRKIENIYLSLLSTKKSNGI
jgi:glycosyltransferase involved in cell wall biosynthesis